MAKHPLREAARGRPCTIQIPGVCNHNPETSVLCHLPSGGMGMKSDDRHAAIGCSSCHDIVDGRVRTTYHWSEMEDYLVHAVIRTQKIWIKEGLM